MKQLFNSNRIFRYENIDKKLEIINPNSYRMGREKIDELMSIQQSGFTILQQGVNQSGRDTWNKLNGLQIPENINIEYFKIEEKKEHNR